ncbi:MAG: isoprenylcysteine carboxylmethyltransferase family protein [Lachnospiraceae bacterium]|nr:isoprenylcysteine carboxylmethyltransferase family protein [Lachnospiraceae bacterium]
MIYQVIAIMIMGSFYAFYFAKIWMQKKQSIKTNQMGVGNKPKKVLLIERIMSCATVLACIMGIGSIILVKHVPISGVRIAGVVVGIIGVLFFALATITMKSSWRVGIPEEKTVLITQGIYRFSRNPAFVGFDLLYLSVCLMFFNIPLLLVSLWAAVMLHLQIIQEEAHMSRMFGEEYETYRKKTRRYFCIPNRTKQ